LQESAETTHKGSRQEKSVSISIRELDFYIKGVVTQAKARLWKTGIGERTSAEMYTFLVIGLTILVPRRDIDREMIVAHVTR
jgi:hypothetical protein